MNPNVEVVLGDSSLFWDDLAKIVSLLYLEDPTSRQWQLDPTVAAWELPFSRIHRIRLRHRHLAHQPSMTGIEAMPEYFEDVESSVNPGGGFIDLLDLLIMARALGATDPRDKVYVSVISLAVHIPSADRL